MEDRHLGVFYMHLGVTSGYRVNANIVGKAKAPLAVGAYRTKSITIRRPIRECKVFSRHWDSKGTIGIQRTTDIVCFRIGTRHQ